MSEFGDNLFMGADSHAAGLGGLDGESADAADASGNNEENHGDNGMLSVTCGRAVTHTIARDGIIKSFAQ